MSDRIPLSDETPAIDEDPVDEEGSPGAEEQYEELDFDIETEREYDILDDGAYDLDSNWDLGEDDGS